MLLVALSLVPAFAVGAFAIWRTMGTRDVEILNLIDEAPEAKRRDRWRGPVDAVVLHQMGFSRGDDPRRYLKVTAHFLILPSGLVVQLHPISARLSASDQFNDRSVAIEFAGNFKSARGGWWKPEKYGRHTPTEAQLESGRRLLRMLGKTGVRHVFAHRQSSASRGNDPGPEVWRAVGEWAIDVLGWSDGGKGYAIGDGAPIPTAWRGEVAVA